MNMTALILLLSYFYIGCSSSESEDNRKLDYSKIEKKSNMDYKAAIETISAKVVDLTAPSDLFTINEFINIYENSPVFRSDALKFISDKANDIQRKQIAVYSMQNLPDSLYINFCVSIANFFIKDIISEEVFQTAVFNSINERYIIIKNYKDQKVIIFLNTIKSFSQNEELRNKIGNLLSGKLWSNLSNFINNN